MTKHDNDTKARAVSPVSRRVFLRTVPAVLVAGAAVASTAGCGGSGGGSSNCGYCDGAGRNYTHCDGGYCNYLNYGD